MAKPAFIPDPMDELRLPTVQTPDRLPAMLFLAALIHGVLIIGIGFNPELPRHFAEAISLEVTIVADPDQVIDRPDRAEYLAQASQEGGGNTMEQTRASAPLRNESPLDNLGDEDGNHFIDTRTLEQRADELIAAQSPSSQRVRDDNRMDPKPEQLTAQMLESGQDITLPLPQEPDATLKIHDDKRQLIISADTRESNIAAYLDSWKRRIERVGEQYFPDVAAGLSGSPTLEVSIDASGELSAVVIRKSSGSRILDEAALDILERASPFDPFPPEVRAEYDELRFAYKWLFGDGQMATTVASAN
ncbi:MAG: energy transducer TonB [Woeseiaceae bacterium]|nr:energy transducer TonB [Woeseiaceae bacterium]